MIHILSFLALAGRATWDVLYESAPFLLLGFLLAGVVKIAFKMKTVSRLLSGEGFRQVLNATLIGIPLPLCSCSVIPVANALRQQGASKSATMSFLISTPETGVDSISISYALLGIPLTIIRVVTTFITASAAGFLTIMFNRGTRRAGKGVPLSGNPGYGKDQQDETGVTSLRGKEIRLGELEAHCCSPASSSCGSSGDDCVEAPEQEGPKVRKGLFAAIYADTAEALRYGLIVMIDDLAYYLIVGFVLAGIISAALPSDFAKLYIPNTTLQMLLILGISVPLYICASSSTPLALALLLKGFSPGAALILLLAGPATNTATFIPVWKMLGLKGLATYLSAIISVSLLAGYLTNSLARSFPILPTATGEGFELLPAPVHWVTALALTCLILFFGAARLAKDIVRLSTRKEASSDFAEAPHS